MCSWTANAASRQQLVRSWATVGLNSRNVSSTSTCVTSVFQCRSYALLYLNVGFWLLLQTLKLPVSAPDFTAIHYIPIVLCIMCTQHVKVHSYWWHWASSTNIVISLCNFNSSCVKSNKTVKTSVIKFWNCIAKHNTTYCDVTQTSRPLFLTSRISSWNTETNTTNPDDSTTALFSWRRLWPNLFNDLEPVVTMDTTCCNINKLCT